MGLIITVFYSNVVQAKIVFVSDRDGDQEIFVMNADGTNVTQITFNDVSDIQPVWSPTY